MIGESGSGKTSLLLRFSENKFNPNEKCTVGLDLEERFARI